MLRIIMLLLASQPVLADIYVCEQGDGGTSYQDEPCDGYPVIPPKPEESQKADKPSPNETEDGSTVQKLSPDIIHMSAMIACPEIIESLAKWDFKWTDGFLESQFQPRPMSTDKPNVIAYYGDKLKLQNGFGAWSNVIYFCEINEVTGKIVDVYIKKGRL